MVQESRLPGRAFHFIPKEARNEGKGKGIQEKKELGLFLKSSIQGERKLKFPNPPHYARHFKRVRNRLKALGKVLQIFNEEPS